MDTATSTPPPASKRASASVINDDDIPALKVKRPRFCKYVLLCSCYTFLTSAITYHLLIIHNHCGSIIPDSNSLLCCRAYRERSIKLLLEEVICPDASYNLPCYIHPLANAFTLDTQDRSKDGQSGSTSVGFGVHRFLDLDAEEGSSCSTATSSSDSSHRS